MSAKEIKNTIIFQHLIEKSHFSEDLMCREVLGTLLADLVGMNGQKAIFSFERFMVEKVSGMTLSSLSEQMDDELKKLFAQKLAEKLMRVKRLYEIKKEMIGRVFCNLSFDHLVELNRNKFLEVFCDPVGLKEIEKMAGQNEQRMTICHGDLNLSNVMIVGSELVFIDFEHVVEAPISYDLACSFLFDDEKSLDLDSTINALSQVGILIPKRELVLMTKLYLIDQLRKCDIQKEQQLLKLAAERKLT